MVLPRPSHVATRFVPPIAAGMPCASDADACSLTPHGIYITIYRHPAACRSYMLVSAVLAKGLPPTKALCLSSCVMQR